ncbi:MAG: sulfide/dihydroorotate dehydrogenase-like FAD/NAD-binding protein [Clostridia bacterium]|jgi:ferredoxin--NADP+ reductase|nr:sulfide/dihydroorotate dehydrogenase-like FAD/NAD-binding protein [Clostridia bacterium]
MADYKRFEVTWKRRLNDNMVWLRIYAPLVAKHAKPGQFIILRTDEYGERIPLTMAGHNSEDGTIDLIYAAVGRTTMLMDQLEVGDCFADIVGPLGKPTHMEGLKSVCVIGGGTGNALAYPLACGMKAAGVDTYMIEGFKTKDLVILEDELKENLGADHVFVVTDDGSYGEKMFTTQKLEDLIAKGYVFDEVVAVGPPIMMKFTCEIAKKHGIKSVASLTAYMIDGTGMCGGCRCKIGGEDKFVCVDGPEFDGELVDWDDLIRRSAYYREQEAEDRQHICRLTGGVRYND